MPPDLPLTITLFVTPLLIAAAGELVAERAGVVNIGIEGMMLTAAFAGFIVGAAVALAIPAQPLPFFGLTPALVIGVLAAIAAGMALSALHAWLSITVRADQIISGTIINVAALGLTGYFNRLIVSPNPTLTGGTFSPFIPPAFLTDLPFVGWIFKTFFNQGPITMSVLVLVIVLQILLFRSRWGLRTRADGENPRAAETVGVNVILLRYRNVILGGVFAGLAGAYLTLEATGSFQNGMTTGRGFIALAAVIFGRWTPIGAFGAALLFTVSDALSVAIQFRPPTGTLGDILTAIPSQAYSSLPYLVTIVVLAGVVGRSVAPAAVGRPYEKESRG
jgi:simple sugar transport system permease protein